MRLATATPLAPPTLAAFGRLNAADDAPVALALSGGGDSLALLHLAKAWADTAGRRLIALTVDHGLQPESAAWSRFAADRAQRLGVAHRSLVWTGVKPDRGLAAAARQARHALLTDAARAAGARVVLMAHTADDLAEAAEMRAAGSTTPSPRVWSPSPAWPEGRGVFLLRPLLGCRRTDLRDLLRGLGEIWIDDPANDDDRFARARARQSLAGRPAPPPPWAEAAVAPAALGAVAPSDGGEFRLPRTALVRADPAEARRLLGALALCAAGTSRPAASLALERLLQRLAAGEDFTASLAGARIQAQGDRLTVCREVGERWRGGLAEAAPSDGEGESVFDGRFLVRAPAPGWRVRPLAGLASRLDPRARRRLRALVPAARAALPALVSPDGRTVRTVLSETGASWATSLTLQRLHATLGAICDEASLWRVAIPAAGA